MTHSRCSIWGSIVNAQRRSSAVTIMRRRYWAIDTEYLMSGRADEDDVHSLQVSDGYDRNHIFWNRDPFYDWLTKQRPRLMYTWSARPEFGSLMAWELIGAKAFSRDMDRVQRFELTRPDGKKTLVLDIQPFFKELGFGSLDKAGRFLSELTSESLLKLEKPTYLGQRAPTEAEKSYFAEYALQDARVTARAAEWFNEQMIGRFMGAKMAAKKLKPFYSFGTIAKNYFKLPQINVRMGRKTLVRVADQQIHDEATFAGRSEAFVTGYVGPAVYNDVSKLYPVSCVATDALRIKGVKPLDSSSLAQLSKPNDLQPYGWISGVFKTDNDLWGLPVRGLQRNYYVTGAVYGIFHTFDLMAAKAEILEAHTAYVPNFREDKAIHDEHAQLVQECLEKQMPKVEYLFFKGVTNSLSGKLGQSDPVSVYSNYPAYSTIVAKAHLIMSGLFDQAPKPIYGMDTDSIFSPVSMAAKYGELTDLNGEHSVPLLVDEKGRSDAYGLIMFRSKHYYLNEESVAHHAWQPLYEDWLKIVQSLPESAEIRRQVKGTFKTRAAKAKELQIGRWYIENETVKTDQLVELFSADDKRVRSTYDSYSLARDRGSVGSRALTITELRKVMAETTDRYWLLTTPEASRKPSPVEASWVGQFAQQAGQSEAL